MGYWTSNPDAVVITQVIGPGPASSRSTVSFEPDADYQQREIDRIYLDSGRVHSYLGDWHSHPQPSPRPSARDRRTLRAIANTREARAPNPIMGIVTNQGAWNLALWKGRVSGFTRRLILNRLQIRSF